ncbi:MAG: ABC transporter ATP-binding protein [Rickettsiales bacterium]|jgi:putative ABC transport system ATP-binding protein|nr:ABC transporter ATP-binding protein [Rickettsiales bacterium]
MIEIKNLIFQYSGQTALNIENLSIKDGEHVFLSGESGSGKSTLLNIIAGILNYQNGSVKVLNAELKNMKASEKDKFRNKNIGFIFQQFNLIPYLSVIDNIVLPSKFSNTISNKSLEQMLAKIELTNDLWDKRADKLSVGQQQRVACIRALYCNPSLIIADEPTSSLDNSRQDAFLELLKNECKNKTLLFVSHDKNLMKWFDRVVEIKDGVINDI